MSISKLANFIYHNSEGAFVNKNAARLYVSEWLKTGWQSPVLPAFHMLGEGVIEFSGRKFQLTKRDREHVEMLIMQRDLERA